MHDSAHLLLTSMTESVANGVMAGSMQLRNNSSPASDATLERPTQLAPRTSASVSLINTQKHSISSFRLLPVKFKGVTRSTKFFAMLCRTLHDRSLLAL